MAKSQLKTKVCSRTSGRGPEPGKVKFDRPNLSNSPANKAAKFGIQPISVEIVVFADTGPYLAKFGRGAAQIGRKRAQVGPSRPKAADMVYVRPPGRQMWGVISIGVCPGIAASSFVTSFRPLVEGSRGVNRACCFSCFGFLRQQFCLEVLSGARCAMYWACRDWKRSGRPPIARQDANEGRRRGRGCRMSTRPSRTCQRRDTTCGDARTAASGCPDAGLPSAFQEHGAGLSQPSSRPGWFLLLARL